MPLVLKSDVTFAVPVSVEMPTATGWEVQSFTAICRPLTQSAIDRIYAGGGGDAELLRQAVAGWEGVENPGGDAVTLDELMDWPNIRVATTQAYIDALYRTKRGN